MRPSKLTTATALAVFSTSGLLGSTAMAPTAATKATATAKTVSAPGERTAIGSAGAVIEAEDYASGGEGTAYHDTTAGNGHTTTDPNKPAGGYYRSDDVDLEPTSIDNSRGENKNFDVGSTADGEWLRYDIDVATAGQYDISARLASPYASGQYAFALDDPTKKLNDTTRRVPVTGGYQAWISKTQRLSLPAGEHSLYFRVDKGGFNLDRLTVVPAGQGWATTVGLGSSYAAGPGVAPFTRPNSRGFIKNGFGSGVITCERSRWNQVNQLADRTGQRDAFYDASCPSDRSESIANSLNADGSASSIGDELAEAGSGYRSTAPGTGALGTGTTTVTVAIGGNDVYTSSDGAYSGSVTGQMYACFQAQCVDSSGQPTATGSNRTKGLRAGDITVPAVVHNLRPIVDQIRTLAPNARIRFISYPSVFGVGQVSCSGGDGKSAWSYGTDETSYLQGLLNTLTGTQSKALEQIRAAENLDADRLQLVDIRAASQDHNVCATPGQRWISQPTGDTASAAIHPNRSMFAMEAEQVAGSL